MGGCCFMRFKTFIKTTVVWLLLLVCISPAATKRMQNMAKRPMSDTVAADEKPTQYPALDLEDLCRKAKNPKCEAIIDNYCYKACNVDLCSQFGSIRAMCRLMCEAEDLLPQCLNMKSSPPPQQTYNNSMTNPMGNPMGNPFTNPSVSVPSHYGNQYPPQFPSQPPSYSWGVAQR